jgi:crossover junction endonuclease MUS81
MSQCGNPLLLGWVKEWWDQAKDRNSKGASVYKKAYESLKACPLTYDHPSQAQELAFIGPTLCARLTKKMEEHCIANGLPAPKKPRGKKRKSTDEIGEIDEDEEAYIRPGPAKKQRKKPDYVPRYKTGPYAIIIALATLHEDEGHGLTKAEVIERAQPHCTASFTAPDNEGSYFTAWNSMKTLIDKELVFKKGGVTKRYNLSDDGWDVAKRIKLATESAQGPNGVFRAAEKQSYQKDSDENPFEDTTSTAGPSKFLTEPNFPDVVPRGRAITSAACLPEFSPVVLEPATFTVELVLDIREIRAKVDRDYMQEHLIKSGVKPIMRALALGDVTWVAKLKQPGLLSRRGCEGDEVVLDYIVERKRLDDLVSSIKDRRFIEQKFRLQKSGIKNKIYIIEEFTGDFSQYESHIATAIASTQVINGFFVKKTQRMDDTIKYLVNMTAILKKIYETKPLHVIPTNVITMGNYLPLLSHLAVKEPDKDYHITYDAFASLSSKSDSLTLRDVFLKMLMCTRGLTGEKAIEIQKRWPTPNSLVEAYSKIEQKEGGGEQARKKKAEMVADEMGSLVGRKKIQKALSAKIAEVWGQWESKANA